jgi:hypothetical protein
MRRSPIVIGGDRRFKARLHLLVVWAIAFMVVISAAGLSESINLGFVYEVNE